MGNQQKACPVCGDRSKKTQEMFSNSFCKCPVCNRPTVLIERLKQHRPNPKDLAHEIKIPASYVSLVYEGQYLTTDREITSLMLHLQDEGCFSADWVINGKGQPYSSLKNRSEQERAEIRSYARQEITNLMFRYGKYDEDVSDEPAIINDYSGHDDSDSDADADSGW